MAPLYPAVIRGLRTVWCTAVVQWQQNRPSSDKQDDEQKDPAKLVLGCFHFPTCAKPELQLSSTVEKRQDC